MRRYSLGRYLVGATVARTGDEMSGPALLLLGLTMTGSVQLASALLAGLTISAALGGPVLGALLDRSPRPGGLLAAALGCYAAGLAVLLTATGRAPTPAVIVVALLTGLLNPAVSGGWTAQLPAVATTDFARANSFDAMTFGAASLSGPALAGLLANAVGAPVAMIAAVVLVGLGAPAAWALPRRAPRTVRPLPRDLLAGVRVIAGSPSLRRATAASVVSFVGVGMLVVCSPLLGEQRFGDSGTGAVLLAVLAATALLTNAALARTPGLLHPDTVVLVSTLVLGAGMVLAGVSQAPAFAVVAVIAAGIGEGPQLTALFAIRHREAPDDVRAQVFTTGASLKITGFAAGSALAGPLATWSLEWCLLIAAAIEVTAAAIYGLLTVCGPKRVV